MDKFFSNLTGGGDKKKPNNNSNRRKKDENGDWQGGRSGGMESIKKSNSRIGAGRVGGGAGSGSGGNAAGNKNPNIFANAGAGINEALGKIDLFNQNKKANSRGGGQSLGGSLPGRVFSVCLDKPGPLGMEVERRKNNQGTTIIARVVPDSQAALAGLQRGDIVCYAGSNGVREIPYDEILAMAKSGNRPLKFDVRRIESSLAGGGNATKPGGGRVSADAEARKQAMIAAAEAREAKHKAKTKPVSKSSSTERLYLRDKRAESTQQNQPHYAENDSEETKRAIAAIKKAEKDDAENLGYNPYESKAMTGGQARTATVAMTKGEIDAGNAPQKMVGGDNGAPGRVAAPIEPAGEASQPFVDIPVEFDHAFATLVTSNDNNAAVVKSLGIIRKLTVNATTKGQQGNLNDESTSKFRRVRLSNPKIKEAITDLQGGLDLMMTMGFLLSENEGDGETYLVYPPGERGPGWLNSALARMEAYENGGS